MIKKILLLLLLLSSLALSSCTSWLMPYSSSLGCRRDPASGYCGSISKVYKQSFVDQNNKGVNQ